MAGIDLDFLLSGWMFFGDIEDGVIQGIVIVI